MHIKNILSLLILNLILSSIAINALDCPIANPILDGGELVSSLPINLDRCFIDTNYNPKCLSIWSGSIVKGQIQTITYGVYNKKAYLTYTGERVCLRFDYERLVLNCVSNHPNNPGNLLECREYCYPLSAHTFKVAQIDAFNGCSTIYTDHLQPTWTY
ncbi:expressed protein [Dictyostelium purpureum]|uniref:Expressed protein n=1 Tax=Dictyostelium purpureum TaxID=5786 RepID=F0ZGM6_DICPU|nr:uncharacterized protein DICPUDRAFT_91742 [Dictyostelium purpureum]EGC36931.1 expressed protein [Dictyostelium purpureum]|eukprot:XP_003286574.1 expressed protein [Dictyostelium purpureum]